MAVALLTSPVEHDVRAAGAAIGELRRLSGLTWEQLAKVFDVSRRTLHFWASGKTMAANHEEQLQRVLSVVRRIDRGSASENRAALLCASGDEARLPVDLLACGDYEAFIKLVGTGPGRREMKLALLSPEALEARKPQPPEVLVGALQDRIHLEGGKTRAAKSVKVRSGR